MEDKKDMEELIQTLQEICVEHLVMRRILQEDSQITNVRERCQLKHYRDAVRDHFREKLGSNLDSLPNEIDTGRLIAALETTNLGN